MPRSGHVAAYGTKTSTEPLIISDAETEIKVALMPPGTDVFKEVIVPFTIPSFTSSHAVAACERFHIGDAVGIGGRSGLVWVGVSWPIVGEGLSGLRIDNEYDTERLIRHVAVWLEW